MAESGSARDVPRHGRNVDVAEAVFFVANVALFFEDTELGANRRVAGLVSKFREDLANRGTLELVENVHDLALAAGKCI
jgi:hypothetical protein